MQIKTTMRYHLTPVTISTNNKCQRGCRRKGTPSNTVGGNVNLCRHWGKMYESSLKNLKYNYYMNQQFHSWVYIQKDQKH